MRIAFFTDVYRPTINGVVVSIDSFAERLRELGHTVTIICPNYPDTPEDETGVIRVPAVTFPAYKEYQIASPFSHSVMQHMKSNVYDVVHIHSPFSVGLAGIYYARRYRLPVIYTAHTDYAEYRHYVRGGRIMPSKVVDKLAAVFSNRVSVTIAPSQKIADGLVRYGTEKPVVILPTGIPPLPAGDRQRAKTRYGLGRAVNFLYLGRTTKEKSLEFLLDAFRQALPGLQADTRLIIAGDGPHRKALEHYSAELGIGSRVVFTGFVTGQNKADVYSAADVFCHVSHSETQGLTLVEASAYGLPLLITDDAAYAGIAVPGVNADIIADDTALYGEQMVALAHDTEKRKAYGEASKTIARGLSIEAQTDRLVRVYEDAIVAKRTAVLTPDERSDGS
jgi:glycosyltransferase involved in cell wall biosynthesis